jgi:hypothetical protein
MEVNMADQPGTLSKLATGAGDLFKNKLFIQMLSGLGAGIAGEGSPAAALNQMTQQNISAQNFSNLLSQVLGGGGKMTMDKDKFNVTGPMQTLLQGEEGGIREGMQQVAAGQMGLPQSTGTTATPQAQPKPNPFLIAL